MPWRWHEMSVDDDVRAFAGHSDPASQPVGTYPAGVVPDSDPCDLILTNDHPRRRIGCMVGLVEIIRSVHVNVGGIRIHLFAIVSGRRSRPVPGRAIVFVVFEQDLYVGASNEIPRGNGRHARLRGPLAQVLGKRWGKLAHP